MIHRDEDRARYTAEIARSRAILLRASHVLQCFVTHTPEAPHPEIVCGALEYWTDEETLHSYEFRDGVREVLGFLRRHGVLPAGSIEPCGITRFIMQALDVSYALELTVSDYEEALAEGKLAAC